MKFRLGELFCGAGVGYAATTAKIDNDIAITHKWATDYNQDACCTYANNIANSHYGFNDLFSKFANSIICEDVRSLDFNQLSPELQLNEKR